MSKRKLPKGDRIFVGPSGERTYVVNPDLRIPDDFDPPSASLAPPVVPSADPPWNSPVQDEPTVDLETVLDAPKPTRRGTTNGNQRGSSYERRRRKLYLLETYRADVDVLVIDGHPFEVPYDHPEAERACRCFRCGTLLTFDTVTVDRIKPAAEGGTYRRSNLRPSCQTCNSILGAYLGNQRRHARKQRSR